MRTATQTIAGLILLTLGALLYLTGSLAEFSYIGQKLSAFRIFSFDLSQWLGPLRGPFPEFIHPLAFSLIGMAVFGGNRMSRVWICLALALIDILFELSQLFKDFALMIIPGWFNKIPVIENTENFVLSGTFSYIDLSAIVCGSLTAFIIAEIFIKTRRTNVEVENEEI